MAQVANRKYEEIETTQVQLQESIALNRTLVEKTQTLIDRHRKDADNDATLVNANG